MKVASAGRNNRLIRSTFQSPLIELMRELTLVFAERGGGGDNTLKVEGRGN